jgi:heme oxygenase (mycobilin-producing)
MLRRMLVVSRFVVSSGWVPAGGAGEGSADAFVDQAHAALRVLAACKGYLRGRLGRSLDEPEHWTMITEWESVGAYRRALSSFDVKVHATPLLAQSLDEPSAYEVLADAAPGGTVVVSASDRA